MGVRTLIAWEFPEAEYDDTQARYYIYDSTTGRVLSPFWFSSNDELESFLDYLTEAELVAEPLVPYDARDLTEHEWNEHRVMWTVWTKGLCARCGDEDAGLVKVGGYGAPQMLCRRHAPTHTNGDEHRPCDHPGCGICREENNAPVIDINRDGEVGR